MILPGLVSLAFYKRRPTALQVTLGLVFTVGLSAVLGYYSPSGGLGQTASIVIAIAGGVILYVGILLYLVYRYQPKHRAAPASSTPP